VVANASNTIGLVPAGAGAALGFRRELRLHRGLTYRVVLLAGIAGSVGAALLLALPPGVFEAIVPWLILGTCVLVGVQPRLSAWLAVRRAPSGRSSPRVTLGPLTTFFVFVTGIYGRLLAPVHPFTNLPPEPCRRARSRGSRTGRAPSAAVARSGCREARPGGSGTCRVAGAQ
jgi:uncharacterized membrane protein YfcA